jgi:cytidine deaminase
MAKRNNHLLNRSKAMLKYSYCPLSKFRVGAAIMTSNGKVFTGCNIENISYGLSMCAERVALFNAVSSGYSRFEAIAISSSGDKPVFPCGACRQFLAEFNSDLLIHLDKDKVVYKLSELIPYVFNETSLK